MSRIRVQLCIRALERLFCILLIGYALCNSAIVQASEREYVLATASPGGTYFPVGTALATLIKVELKPRHGISMVAVPTAGSAENIRLLEGGEAQFAIIQGLIGHDAWNGKRSFSAVGPKRKFRAITALWQNVEQFVIRSEFAKTGTISDFLALKNKRVGLGEKDSGTLISNRILLGNLGVDIGRDYRLAYLGYGPSTEALRAGDLTGIGIPAGIPTKALTRAKAAMGDAITILSFTKEQARAADGGLGLWKPYSIPMNTYPGQPKPVQSLAQPNLLVVRKDVSKDVVYLVTKIIFEKSEFLRKMHEATHAISLDSALVSIPVPLHPGASRYFNEARLQIPQRLIEK